MTKNQLQSVPDDLVRLTELEHLNLSYNRFDRLPECITQLTTLTELLVCGNRIAELPPSIAALPLVSIDLMSNFLTTVPSALPSLTALTHLNLRRNQLATLPDSLAALGKLKVLDLGENRLTELPAAVAAALSGSLEVLELDHNQLVKLPDAIGQCTVLRRLAVEQNALKALPDAIGNLEALEELIADDNSLTALPASFGVLGKLRVLRAKRNEIGEITAANIASLAALHILDLTLNKLTALPGTLGTALPRLHQLLVGGNRLSDLPQSLAACQRLRVLSAFGNSKLTKLPPGIAQLPRLHTLHVGYCPKLESLGLVATDAEAAAVAAARAEQASKMKRAASQHRAKLSPEEALSDDTAARGTTFDDDASGADSDCDLESDPLVDSSITGPFRALRELQIAGCPNLPPLADTADAAESALGGGGKSLVELYAALGAKKADDDDADADDAAPGGAGDAGVGPVRDENGALLPSLVDAAPRIERLDAAHCGLRNVDAVIGLDNMTRLNLQCNAIESVPEALCEFSQLEELDLSLNSRLQSVPDALAQRAVDETTALEMFVDLTPVGSLPQQRRRPYTASLRMPYGFAEMLGRRPTQEDALMLEGQFGDEAAKMSLYCMFDGHAGHQAAQFCAQRFPPLLSDALAATPDAPSDALRAALAALARAFQTAVEELDPAARHCGTTALVVLVTEEAYHVANLGDTRAVLSRGGKAVRLSHDHKPVDEEERIRELGGYVIGKTTQRVNGMLGVPRSIGDFFVKPYVSEEPYVNVVARQADDDFVMLACDGVWDELDDQRVVDICKKETSAQAAAIRVRDYAYMAGSEDNISTVLVLLRDEGLEPGEVRRRRRKKSTIHVRTNSNSAAATPLHHTVR